jgi:hypothetical protein
MGLDSAVERACTYTGQISLLYVVHYTRLAAENIKEKPKGEEKEKGKGLKKDFHPNWMVNYQTSLSI